MPPSPPHANSDPPDPQSTPSLARRLGPAGILGIAWAIAPPLGGFLLLYKIGPISDWLLAHQSNGVAIYILAFAIAAGLGLMPTYAPSILGGWVFGLRIGFLGALSGFAAGATLGYIVARTVARDRVIHLVDANPKARAVRDALVSRGFLPTLGTVALLRLPPNSPFSLTNLVMASARVRFAPYLLGTIAGMAPRTAVAVFLASRASSSSGARDLQAFIHDGPGWPVLLGGIIVMFIAFGAIGLIASRALHRTTSTNPSSSPPSPPPPSP